MYASVFEAFRRRKGKRCDREAMLALHNSYDGKSEVERRKQVAKDNLTSLFYSNETTSSFKKYATKTKKTFNVLENYNVPLYEEDKVRQFLNKINSSKKYLKTEANICRSSHSASFETASTYLSIIISRLFPVTQPSSGRYGWIQQVNSSLRVGRGGRGVRFTGRGGRGRGG